MSTLSSIDPLCTDWTPDSYTIDHPRKLRAIMGDTVIIDIPIMRVWKIIAMDKPIYILVFL